MAGYGWDEYDVRQGGRQTIHDTGNNIDITTEFVKFPGGSHGGSWGIRVKGTPREDAPPKLLTTVVFSASIEGIGSLVVANDPDPLGYLGTVGLSGTSKELGDFRLEITSGPETNKHPAESHETYADKPLDRTMVVSMTVPEDALWQTKGIMFKHMKDEIDAYVAKYGDKSSPPPWQVFTIANRPGTGNLHMVQKVFEGPFQYDILYTSGSAEEPVTSEKLTEKIDAVLKSFSDRFLKVLAPKAPYDSAKYERFAKSIFSNLAGGIGYFYGDYVADRSYAKEYEEENEGFWQETAEARTRAQIKIEGPSELFTAIPSRTFFPRGFLWDEGFHLLPISEFDMDLTLDIVRSWFKLMDEDGWIAREQILGAEARSKVPQEFQVQYPHYANPPTLFLVLEVLMDKIKAKSASTLDPNDPYDEVRNYQLRHSQLAIDYLKDFYPLLKRHYYWFRKTQWGDVKSYDREAYSTKEAYRWRGRTVDHILPSGLDDYPRPQPPHPGELHVDLISWMGMMTRSMRRIAETLGETDDAKDFKDFETGIIHNIEDLHWDKKQNAYCDATIDDYEEHVHVCHKGYISLFPFITGLVAPDSPHLGAILDLIKDPEQLWTNFGIRSLSKKDEFYQTGENYWRSPIWMNINYLILKNLNVS
jgi:mannosyl-oligosaccharide glucosidase